MRSLLFSGGLALLLTTCGGTQAPTCGPSTCGGCCNPVSGACELGSSSEACGNSGAACMKCLGNAVCSLGTCIGVNTGSGGGGGGGGGAAMGGGAGGGGGDNPDGGTGGGGGTTCQLSCPGCCIGQQCIAIPSAQSCGLNGSACVACGSNETCDNGSCRPQVTCDASTCPSGCCANGVCQPGTSTSACGTGGAACTSCSGSQTCTNQQCQAPACGPSTCPTGCCLNGVCQAGTAPSACGTGGAVCGACTSAQACTNQQCVAVPTCGPSNCANGCCVGATCVAGTSTSACGNSGAQCTTCGGGQLCTNQQCVTPPSCGPSSCSGCCLAGTCQTGGSSSACGTGGAVCAACSTGNTCSSGSCVPATDLPTGSACNATSECYTPVAGTRECINWWPGGYCTSSCLLTRQACGGVFGPGYCTPSGDCLLACSGAGLGQSTCRAGYVCDFTEGAGSQGVCLPRCDTPGLTCTSGTCNSQGYCR